MLEERQKKVTQLFSIQENQIKNYIPIIELPKSKDIVHFLGMRDE